MKTKYIFLYCLLFICNAVTAQKVITGAEQMDRLLPILKGKRVALVVSDLILIFVMDIWGLI